MRAVIQRSVVDVGSDALVVSQFTLVNDGPLTICIDTKNRE